MEHRMIKDEVENLHSHIKQKHKDFLLARLQPLGIQTSSRGLVIYTIYKSEGLVQDEISTQLCMDKAFVTRELNVLSKMGLITRKKDTMDRRMNHIFLTDKGREMGKIMVQLETEWLNMAYADFSDVEFYDMKIYAERITKNLNLM